MWEKGGGTDQAIKRDATEVKKKTEKEQRKQSDEVNVEKSIKEVAEGKQEPRVISKLHR
jgi:hypothetical protein